MSTKPKPNTRLGKPLWCADCKSYHVFGLHTLQRPEPATPRPEPQPQISTVTAHLVADSSTSAGDVERGGGEPQQSAVEWVQNIFDSPMFLGLRWIQKRNALELARRCDEAERRWDAEKRAHIIMCERFGDAQDTIAVLETLNENRKAQLAAAQAEAARLREALEKMVYLCEHDLGMDDENPYIELANAALGKKEELR